MMKPLQNCEPVIARQHHEQQKKEAVYEAIKASLPTEIGTDLIFEAITEITNQWPAFDIQLLSSFEVAREKKTDGAYAVVGRDICQWFEYYIDQHAKSLVGLND